MKKLLTLTYFRAEVVRKFMKVSKFSNRMDFIVWVPVPKNIVSLLVKLNGNSFGLCQTCQQKDKMDSTTQINVVNIILQSYLSRIP